MDGSMVRGRRATRQKPRMAPERRDPYWRRRRRRPKDNEVHWQPAQKTLRKPSTCLKLALLVALALLAQAIIAVSADASYFAIRQLQMNGNGDQTTASSQQQQRQLEQLGAKSRVARDAGSPGSANDSHEPANNEKPFASMLNSAVINGKVSLPCDISPASADDSVALILWYKDDSLAPIYTIDARKANSLEKAKTSLDDAYASRSSFNMRSKPAQLQLDRVRQEDEGEYRCRVDFKRGRTVNTLIALRVVVPPEELRIVSPQRPHARLDGLIGPFNEGAELTLLCLATGGKPRPQISWRRDFNVIDETYQHVDKEGTSNELKIPSLSKNHLLSIFTCQASNNNLTSPMQTSITLDLNLKPQEISLKQLGQEPLVVGQTATFECLTQGSRPQATIHWIFQGARHEAQMNVDQQQTSSRISLALQRSFNQQALTCAAENPRIAQAAALRQTLKLDVHYPPQLSVRLEWPGGQSDYSSSGSQQQRQGGSEQQQHQEGNDIYLTCQVDANPRPTKPILWRFNGRALQQNSNMIVMNNQSLVLRKVSRQQAGLYSCDAANQHGSNSSKPVELVIRHAPVCQTDDILVFEAAIGQTVKIDCNVVANPAKSVHYAWFSAPGEQNLTNWTQRDTSLEEQLDESSSRLKFRIKDEHSFGPVKCKAKNEIGLQQIACLFQIVQAPTPALRHTCSLLSSAANSLQVSCSPNEHLKSEEFELIRQQQEQAGATSAAPTTTLDRSVASDQSRSSSSMSGWLNLDAIRRQQPTGAGGGGGDSNQNERLQLRLVYPPNWLLAELYKASASGSGGASRIAAGESSQAQANVTGDSAGQQYYELIAYVIVGLVHQLANIKSIVEENRLFSSNPKSVYYVMARQQQQPNQTSASSDEGPAAQADGQSTSLHGVPAYPTLQFPYQLHLSQQQQARLIEDPSIQLASSFAFTVPSLEPESRYKLLIYGQNLANKTRDWLVVRGETLAEDAVTAGARTTGEATAQSSQFALGQQDSLGSPSSLLDHQVSRSAPNSASSSSSLSLSQQKSIVMRSDTNDGATTADGNQQEQVALEQFSSSAGAGNSGLFVDRTIQQFAVYKDSAITYAKQKPLLAIPIAATTVLVLMLLLIWTTSILASLMRRRAGSPSSSGSSSSSMGSSGSSAGGAGGGKGSGDSASGKQPLPADCDGPRKGALNGCAGGGHLMMGSKRCALSGAGHHHQFAPDSPDASSFNSRQDPGSSADQVRQLMMMAGDDSPADTRHLEQQQQQVYTIEPATMDCGLGSADFRQETTAAAALAKLYPSFGCGEPHFIGSLDRRELLHQPIYLTEPGGRTAFLQVSQENHAHYQFQQHHQFGSIDRRVGAGGFPIFKQQQQPTMMLAAAEPGQLERGEVYLRESPLDGGELLLGELAAAANCYSGSFSSTECSSVQDQAHSLASRSRREQRVAFDLSNQPACKQHQQQQQQQLADHNKAPADGGSQAQMIKASKHEFCPNAAAGGLYVDSIQIRNQRQQRRRQQHGLVGQVKPLQLATTKGSDSGGSNSGNTADSGHESPPTGETNSTSYEAHHRQHQLVGDQNNGDSSNNMANFAQQNFRQQQQEAANLVMLMELSPVSQESSTVLQSVGSYGELSQQSQSQGQGANSSNNDNPLRQTLRNNHQMATSFSTVSQSAANNLCSDHDQQQSQEHETSRLENWL